MVGAMGSGGFEGRPAPRGGGEGRWAVSARGFGRQKNAERRNCVIQKIKSEGNPKNLASTAAGNQGSSRSPYRHGSWTVLEAHSRFVRMGCFSELERKAPTRPDLRESRPDLKSDFFTRSIPDYRQPDNLN
jgi:hypothetical protein